MPIPTAPEPAGAPPAPAPAPPPSGPERLEPVAGILAVFIPGAGHFFLGERYRAAMIALGVLGLFFGGIFIGGIDSIDSREDRIWFIGQALVGPIAFGVDYIHQERFKVKETVRAVDHRSGQTISTTVRRTPDPGANPPPRNRKSIGRMNELGTLFATIAGMMNLIAIIDATFHGRRRYPGD